MTLPANAVSVKAGGEIQNLIVSGGIVTHGSKVTSLEIEGKIRKLTVKGSIVATGSGATGVAISRGVRSPLGHISVRAKRGVAIRILKK